MVGHDRKARIAEAVLENRRQRHSLLPAVIFGEYAWDALLMLFVADAASTRLTGRDIAARLSCSETVMSRWIKYLSQEALIVGDGTGDLDDLLTLSPAAIEALEAYLASTQDYANKFSGASDVRGVI